MNSAPDPSTEVLELCDQILDGTLTPEQQARLETLVLTDSQARRVYVEYLHLHAVLKEARFKEEVILPDIVPLPTVSSLRPARRRNRGMLAVAMTAAAAMLVVGWGLGFWQGGAVQGPTAPVATLIETKGASWGSGTLPTEAGAHLTAGRLSLSAGLATVEFAKGARVTLEGPAVLELLNADACYLHSGALTAHVPPQAVGFIVETARARLVDHGTDFGVSAGGDGQAQVQVFDGKVELQHHSSGERLELNTRQAASITAQRLSRNLRDDDETETQPGVARQDILQGAHVLTITSADGRGKATYAASPGTTTHFSDTLLLLKNSNQQICRRKSWLAFDLESLRGRTVAEASLTLTFEPTGWGYASMVPDAEFVVYGITDDALDSWEEAGLDWGNAPLNQEVEPGVDTSRSVRLGSFTMPQGVLDGAYSVTTPELVEFLNRDGNRLASLIIVRTTKEIKSSGVVHGFAGNHHPTLKPPTLRMVMK